MLPGSDQKFNAFAKAFSNETHRTALEVHCSSTLTQDQLWRLFDVIPGLDYCKIDQGKYSIEKLLLIT